jgi:hypothetical protein
MVDPCFQDLNQNESGLFNLRALTVYQVASNLQHVPFY